MRQRETVLDALRISDNTYVYLKRVPRESREYEVAEFFSSEDRKCDARNHCVPVLDYIEDDRMPEYALIVTPLLRLFNDPEFATIGEILEFVRQTLEVSYLTF